MRRLSKFFWALAVLWLAGCGFLNDARNAIATASTFLAAEQAQNQTKCTDSAVPIPAVCTAINKGIAANNALIDAVNVYCSGIPAAGTPGWNQGGACVPVKTAQSVVTAATANLNQVLSDIKALVGTAPPAANTPAKAAPKSSMLEYRKSDLDAVRQGETWTR